MWGSKRIIKASVQNVLLGWMILIVGLSTHPTAFQIDHHLTPRRCSRARTMSIVDRNTAVLSMARGNAEELPSSKLHACEVNSNVWGMNPHPGTANRTMLPSRIQGFPKLAISLLYGFRNYVSERRTTTATSTKSSIARQCRLLAAVGGFFVLVRFLMVHSTSISLWYMNLLNGSPLVTKTLTTGSIGVLGDTTAQFLETRMEHKESLEGRESNGTPPSTGKGPLMLQRYNCRRGLSCLGENLLISGPLLHFAYNAMEHFVPTSTGGISAVLAALTHALLDNFVLDTCFLAIMFVTTGIAEGYIRELKTQFREDFFPTLRTGWAAGICLLPVQVLLFRFFPLSLRVLGVNIIDIFWEAYVSYMVHRRRRQKTIITEQ